MSQNETVSGGKYLAADGKTYVDAWGRPIEVKDEADKTDPAPRRKPAARKGE